MASIFSNNANNRYVNELFNHRIREFVSSDRRKNSELKHNVNYFNYYKPLKLSIDVNKLSSTKNIVLHSLGSVLD